MKDDFKNGAGHSPTQLTRSWLSKRNKVAGATALFTALAIVALNPSHFHISVLVEKWTIAASYLVLMYIVWLTSSGKALPENVRTAISPVFVVSHAFTVVLLFIMSIIALFVFALSFSHEPPGS